MKDQKNSKKSYNKRFDRKSNRKTDTNAQDERQLGKRFIASRDNDPTWYAASPQLLKDAASLAFSQNLGHKVDLRIFNGEEYTVPGIMTLNYEHTLGGGTTATDAPTIAARYLYSFVRHANSGSANYEAPDLYMYCMAWSQAATFLTMCKRAYGFLLNYTARNRYYVDSVICAMGFDPASLRSNMPAFRAAINLGISRLNSLKIPANFYIHKRWNWLVEHVWVDDPGHKAQTYLFVPISFLKFEGYRTSTGTSLETVPWRGGSITDIAFHGLSDVIDMIDELLNPLTSEEDCGIMSGDIIKAYGTNTETLTLIDENYVVLPEYSEEVLMQIHNFVALPGFGTNRPYAFKSASATNSITQSSSGVIQNRVTWTARQDSNYADSFTTNALLDLYKDDPTPEDVMVLTRFTSIDADGGLFNSVGSEVARSISIICSPIDLNTSQATYQDLIGYVYNCTNFLNTNSSESGIEDPHRISGFLSMFDWHPRVYVGATDDDPSATQSPGPYTAVAIIGDLENYTVVSKEVLHNMNKVAILSETSHTDFTSIG